MDEKVYKILSEYKFSGLEIAPTRIFPKDPYKDLRNAKRFSDDLKENYGLEISSMQSIWFGKSEKIFGTEDERNILIDYSKKAIDFASTIGCKNLVFGCPKNRVINSEEDFKIAKSFFYELGEYAEANHTVLSMEPNPTIYNTNFINYTEEAFELVKKVNSNGLKVNIDLGTMICNNEDVNMIADNMDLINHIHISEPYLAVINHRSIHKNLAKILKENNYEKYVSIEMSKQDDVENIKNIIKYISEVFV